MGLRFSRTSSRLVVALGASLPLALAIAWGCAGDDSSTEPHPGTDATTGGPPIDVGGGSPDGGALSTAMRFAHFAPGFGKIDFCYRKPEQAKLTGPVLGAAKVVDGGADASEAGAADADLGEAGEGDASAADATADADAAAPSPEGAIVPYAVSSYVQLEGTGTFEIAIVRGDSGSCAAPLAIGRVTLDAGHLTTVALLDAAIAGDAGASDASSFDDGGDAGDGGDGGVAAARFLTFTDDPTIDPARARVRVVHLALGSLGEPAFGPLRVTAVSGKNPVVAPSVEPSKATSPSAGEPPVDALGYALVAPVAPLTALRVEELADAGARSFTTTFSDLSLGGASLHTAFVIKDGLVVWCSDKTTVGRRMDCVGLPK